MGGRGVSAAVKTPSVLESTWEKSSFGRRSKLAVLINNSGKVAIYAVSQNMVQRLLSLFVNMLTKGQDKEHFKNAKRLNSYQIADWSKLNSTGKKSEFLRTIQSIVSKKDNLNSKLSHLQSEKIASLVSNVHDDVDFIIQEVSEKRAPLLAKANQAIEHIKKSLSEIDSRPSSPLSAILTGMWEGGLQEWEEMIARIQKCQIEDIGALHEEVEEMQQEDENDLKFFKKHLDGDVASCLNDAIENFQKASSLMQLPNIRKMTLGQIQELKNKAVRSGEKIDPAFIKAFHLLYGFAKHVLTNLASKSDIIRHLGSDITTSPKSLPFQMYNNIVRKGITDLPVNTSTMTLDEISEAATRWQGEYQKAVQIKNKIKQAAPDIEAYAEVFSEAAEVVNDVYAGERVATPYLTAELLKRLDIRKIDDDEMFTKCCIVEKETRLQELTRALDLAKQTDRVYDQIKKEIQTLTKKIQREKNLIVEVKKSSPIAALEPILASLTEIENQVSKYKKQVEASGITLDQAQALLVETKEWARVEQENLSKIAGGVVAALPQIDVFLEIDTENSTYKLRTEMEAIIDGFVMNMQQYQKILDASPSNKFKNPSPFAEFLEKAEKLKNTVVTQDGEKNINDLTLNELKKHRADTIDLLIRRKWFCYEVLLSLYPQGSPDYQKILSMIIDEHKQSINASKTRMGEEILKYLTPSENASLYFMLKPEWREEIGRQYTHKFDQLNSLLEDQQLFQGRQKSLNDLSLFELIEYSHRVVQSTLGLDTLKVFAPFERMSSALEASQHLQENYHHQVNALYSSLCEQGHFLKASEVSKAFKSGRQVHHHIGSTKDMLQFCKEKGDYVGKLEAVMAKIKAESNQSPPPLIDQISEFFKKDGDEVYNDNEFNALMMSFLSEQEQRLNTIIADLINKNEIIKNEKHQQLIGSWIRSLNAQIKKIQSIAYTVEYYPFLSIFRGATLPTLKDFKNVEEEVNRLTALVTQELETIKSNAPAPEL